MAEQDSNHSGDVAESAMDYPEHERTYELFLVGSKWLTILTCAILLGMAFGFFAGGGFFGGLLVFIILSIVSYVLL